MGFWGQMGPIGEIVSGERERKASGKAAKEQAAAAKQATLEAENIYKRASAESAARYKKGRDALLIGSFSAKNEISRGRREAEGRFQEGLGYAQSSSDQARGDVSGGLEAALGSAKSGLRDVTGSRSRLGELYDQNQQFDFQADPGYQFRQQQGEEAINRMASSIGGRGGGATMKALAQFSQGLASQEYSAAFGRHQQGLAQRQGLAGAADQSQQILEMNQAQRQMQLGLSSANLQQGAGFRQAGIAQGLGRQQIGLAELQAQYSTRAAEGAADIESAYGTNLASSYAGESSLQVGLAGQRASNRFGTVSSAGGEQAARAASYGRQEAAARDQTNRGIEFITALISKGGGGGGGGNPSGGLGRK